MTFAAASEIERSLAIAASREGDLNAAIYARLFAQYPETEALFVLDRAGQVRGAMMTHVYETIFDFIGERRYAHRFVQSEIVTHAGYDVPRDAFAAFFGLVRDEVEIACGADWTPPMAQAWRQLLSELSEYVAAA